MKRLLLCLLLLWPGVALAQTRMYLSLSEPAAVSPAFGSGWEDTSEAELRRLKDVKGTEAITIGQTVDIAEDTGNDELDRQFVSTRMAASVVFTSGVTTVKAVVMTREYAGTDDVTQCITNLRVLSEDGLTVRATLLATANYGATLEFINNATHRNHRCADGDTVTSSYTTVSGDRLVFELGYKTDGAETSPQASAKWGDNATDCAENNTGTTDCTGWLELSNTITFIGELTTRRVIDLGGD